MIGNRRCQIVAGDFIINLYVHFNNIEISYCKKIVIILINGKIIRNIRDTKDR